MNHRSARSKLIAIGVILVLGSSIGALAQEDTGNVYATVKDTSGSPLPGVTCELSGFGAPKTAVSNAAGEVRWLSLDPGNWALRCSLEGFSTVEYPNINVRVARNVTIEVQLAEAIGEVITVTSESPLLDERKISTGTTVTQVELETIPTARDPWSLLNQTQGVLVDRINVGGNQSGQQAVFIGQGVSDDENSFLVDGVQITDMAAIGSSPTYYDFDQFTEVQMSTGGADVAKTAAGVSVNMVTKRGTNDFRGSARFFKTDGNGSLGIFDQAEPDIPSSDLGPGQDFYKGNKIAGIEDYGFEAGGPVLRDRLWVWGTWGQNNIRNLIPGSSTNPDALDLKDDTVLENTSVKFNGQVTSANSAVFSWNNGDKVKIGRNASPTRPQETTFNQRGPTAIWKVEDTHVLSSNLFLSGTWSKVDGGFSLTAAGGAGPDAPIAWRDGGSVWHDSFISGSGNRPSEELKADGSYFFNTGQSTSHELKFGARYRTFEDKDQFRWPGPAGITSLALGGGSFPLDFSVRGGGPQSTAKYTSLWVSDTITMGQWTFNAGLRWDLQEGVNEADTLEGIPCGITDAIDINGDLVDACDILPTISVAKADAPFDWSDIQPRLGVTYALGEERKTLIRGSFSQFAEQLESSDINFINPGYYAYAYFYNLTDAANPDPNRRFNEGDLLYFLFPAYGLDPKNPTLSGNRVDPGLSAPLTSEIVVGVEHSFLPEFVVGANATWRETDDILEFRDFIRLNVSSEQPGRVATLDDYIPGDPVTGTLPNGRNYNVPTYQLKPQFETVGDLLINGSRKVNYQGFGVNFVKRLSNQWMLRGYANWANQEWDIPAEYYNTADPNPAELGGDIDGGLYVVQSAGSGAFQNVIIQSSWSWNLNGMYQIAPDRPWGFNVAANLYGREGYPLPYMAELWDSGDGIGRNTRVVTEEDEIRVPDIFTTDLRFEKEFAAAGNLGFTFSIDAFNIFNENTVLQRERDVTSSQYDWLRETLSPRIYRLGVRLNWR